MDYINLVNFITSLIANNTSETIAIAALLLAVWQGWVSRSHNKLSVEPRLMIYSETLEKQNTETFKLYVKNTGLGPAIVEEFFIGVYGKGFIRGEITDEAWISALQQCTGTKIKLQALRAIHKNYLIGAGENILISEISYKSRSFDPTNEIVSGMKYKTFYNEVRTSAAGVNDKIVFAMFSISDFFSIPKWLKKLRYDMFIYKKTMKNYDEHNKRKQQEISKKRKK
tara:strand:+ start:148 stop:825 length:678 start_codon:yes stop_codon:yes gene_type:complete